MMKFVKGATVWVTGRWKRRLIHKLDIPGGWVLDRPVLGLRCWNQDEMTLHAD